MDTTRPQSLEKPVTSLSQEEARDELAFLAEQLSAADRAYYNEDDP